MCVCVCGSRRPDSPEARPGVFEQESRVCHICYRLVLTYIVV